MLGLTKPRTATGALCGINVGTLESVRSVGGWEMGVIVSPDHRQATVQFDLPDTDRLDEPTWRAWEQAISGIPQIVATFSIDTLGDNTPVSRAGAVFRAVGSDETKNHDRFLADIATGVAPLFDAADALFPTPSRPLDPSQLCEHLTAGLGVAPASTWAGVTAATADEADRSVTIGDTEWSVFQTPPDADTLLSELDELTADWEGSDWLRRTRVFRPLIVADADDDSTLAGEGRRHQLITTIGGTEPTASMIDYLSSPAAIALRRSWQRQKALAIAGLGTGFLGFQQPLAHLRHPAPLPHARF